MRTWNFISGADQWINGTSLRQNASRVALLRGRQGSPENVSQFGHFSQGLSTFRVPSIEMSSAFYLGIETLNLIVPIVPFSSVHDLS